MSTRAKTFALVALALFALLAGVAVADLGFSEVDVITWRHSNELKITTFNSLGHVQSVIPFPEFTVLTESVSASISPETSTVYIMFKDFTANGLSVKVRCGFYATPKYRPGPPVGSISYLSKRVLYPLTALDVQNWQVDDVRSIFYDTLSGTVFVSGYNSTTRTTCFYEVSMHSGRSWWHNCTQPNPDTTHKGYEEFTASVITGSFTFGEPALNYQYPYCNQLCVLHNNQQSCAVLDAIHPHMFTEIVPIYDSDEVFIVTGHPEALNGSSLYRLNPRNSAATLKMIGALPAKGGEFVPISSLSYYHAWRKQFIALWPQTGGIRLLAMDIMSGKMSFDTPIDVDLAGWNILAFGVRLAEVVPAPTPVVVPAPVEMAPGYVNPPSTDPVQPPTEHHNNNDGGNGAVVGIIIAAVIVLAAGVGFFLWRHYRASSNNLTGYEHL